MQDNIYYLIDKNLVEKNILKVKDNKPLNLNSVIDGRNEFYGLGNDLVSVINKNDISYVLVNDIKEAINLRKYDDSINIIIKNLNKDYIFDAIVNNVAITIYSYKELDELVKLDIKDDYDVFLYIDDGVEGFNNLTKINKYIEQNKHLKIIGVYSEVDDKKSSKKSYEIVKNIMLSVSSDIIQFIISDNEYDLNTNYFSKCSYAKNINEVISLQASLNNVKKFYKNDVFLTKKLRKNKNFGIVNIPYMISVKKVFIKNKIYNVKSIYNGKLIIELDDYLKSRMQVEILGLKSKNDIGPYININGIPKYYLLGSSIEKEKIC